MKTTVKTMFLAAGLAALAPPVAAQSIDPVTPKPTDHASIRQSTKHPQRRAAQGVAGEAASLQREEADPNDAERGTREDNRRRITSAPHAQLHHKNQISKSTGKHRRNTASAVNVNQQHRAAELKTGQLTTRQASHLKTQKASLHHHTRGAREQDRKLTPKDADAAQPNQQDTNTNQIHLKKHNARMF